MNNLNEIYEIVFNDFEAGAAKETSLEDLGFDSMAQILLLGELDERFGLILDPESLSSLTTLEDLENFLLSNIK